MATLRTNPVYTVFVNGKEIPDETIASLLIEFTIDDLLPHGVLKMSDPQGESLARLGIAIGKTVSIKVTDVYAKGTSSKSTDFEFCDLIIAGLDADGQKDKLRVGGLIVLTLVHPWLLFKDHSNHAYPPMVLSELIVKVIKESNRGYTIPLDTKNVCLTDDKGDQPRYKCGIADCDFITQQLLPFCSSEKGPVFAFIDEEGSFHLKNFKMLFSSTNPKGHLVPDKNTLALVRDQADAMGKVDEYIEMSSISVVIGGDNIADLIRSIAPRVYIDNLLTGRTTIATAKQAVFADENNKFVPVDKTLMSSVGPTDCRILSHRSLNDAIALNIENSSNVMNMFAVDVTAKFSENVSVGSPVFLSVIYDNAGSDQKTHWMCGKWIVGKKACYSDGVNLEAKMGLRLVRPSFVVGNEDTISVEHLSSSLHKVS